MTFETLASQGAMGVAGGSLALWAGMLFGARPLGTHGAAGAVGGFDTIGYTCFVAATFVVFAVLAGVHFVLGRQLLAGPRPITGVE